MRGGKGIPGIHKWQKTAQKKGKYEYEHDWDAENLTFNGVQLNCEINPVKFKNSERLRNPLVQGIPFADLAVDVAHHPSYASGDGFMLGRCVQYAAAKPQAGYMFPQDLAHLVQKLDDGRTLQPHHLNAASAAR